MGSGFDGVEDSRAEEEGNSFGDVVEYVSIGANDHFVDIAEVVWKGHIVEMLKSSVLLRYVNGTGKGEGIREKQLEDVGPADGLGVLCSWLYFRTLT